MGQQSGLKRKIFRRQWPSVIPMWGQENRMISRYQHLLISSLLRIVRVGALGSQLGIDKKEQEGQNVLKWAYKM